MLKYKCSYKENGACYVVVASTWLILLVLSVKLFCNARNVNGVKYTLSCLLSLLSEGQAGAACELPNTVALFWKSAALIPLRRNDTQELAWSNIFCLSWNVELSCALMTACRGMGGMIAPIVNLDCRGRCVVSLTRRPPYSCAKNPLGGLQHRSGRFVVILYRTASFVCLSCLLSFLIYFLSFLILFICFRSSFSFFRFLIK